jgi:hypothetical protein
MYRRLKPALDLLMAGFSARLNRLRKNLSEELIQVERAFRLASKWFIF